MSIEDGFVVLPTRAQQRERANAATPETGRADSVACSELLARLTVEAEAAAANWTPFTQNHCPDFQRWSKKCFADGYVSGAFAAEERANVEALRLEPARKPIK